MHRRADDQGRSRAMESSDDDALQRAGRFLKLGFVVYAISDPKGAVFMDEGQISDYFGVRERVVPATVDFAKPRR
jgi:hypothetical protein